MSMGFPHLWEPNNYTSSSGDWRESKEKETIQFSATFFSNASAIYKQTWMVIISTAVNSECPPEPAYKSLMIF